ncbi:hypothetical protein Lal_00045261 [Lupinus albus]|nr:hypothetical protein Lal_00045261 [Lupinus albus]
MSSENTSSPTVSPRTENFTSILQELHEEFRTIKRQMADMQVQQNRQQNRRHSSHDESSDSESERRRRRRRERRNEEDNQRERRRDDRVEGVQIKVPTFMGMNNPEAYMEWEMKIEQVFDCHNYSEEKKVKVAALEFKEYAMVWWDQLQKDRRRCGAQPVSTWEEMRSIMRKINKSMGGNEVNHASYLCGKVDKQIKVGCYMC